MPTLPLRRLHDSRSGHHVQGSGSHDRARCEVNHTLKRIALGASSAMSIGVCLASVQPRIVAWNQTSQAVLIASQRAASCTPLNYVRANSVPTDYASKQPFEPGTLVCDWQGRTGQINGYHSVDYVRQGQAKQINEVLINRGFQAPQVQHSPIN